MTNVAAHGGHVDGGEQRPTAAPATPLTRRAVLSGGIGTGLGVALATAGGVTGCSARGERSPGSGADHTLPPDPLAIPGGPKTTRRTDVPPAGYPPGYVGPIASRKGPCTRNGRTATLRVVVRQTPEAGNWAKNSLTQWYEEQTHVHIDWQVVAGGDDTMTKVNAMIAAGDLPDVFMSVPFTNSQMYLYWSQGLFIPLQDLMHEYCPEAQRMFHDYPETEKLLTTRDGNIYTFPFISDCFHCKYPSPVWIYTPWLDKLGLDMPQTTQEFVRVLRAFKAHDLNGPGSPLTPMSGSQDDGLMSDFFMGSFLYNPLDPWLYLDNGAVDIAVDKPEWREGWRYTASLVKEGLLDKYAFTQSNEQLRRQAGAAKQPTIGAIRAYYWGSWQNIDDNDPHAQFRDYHAVPTLKGPDGAQVAAWNYYGWLWPESYGYVVTKACKNPAVAVMWADSQCELVNFLTAYNGVDPKGGETWRFARKDERGINGDPALWSTTGTWPPQPGEWWAQQGLSYRSSDFRLGEVADPRAPTFEQQLYEDTKQAYYPHRQPKDQQLPFVYLSEDQAATVADASVAVTNQVQKMESRFCLGQADIGSDQQWRAYTEAIKKIGIEAYLQAYQDAYDAWRKATANK